MNNEKKLKEVTKLVSELLKLKGEYYQNRTRLAFSLPGEMTEEEFTEIELVMPLLEERINDIEREFKEMTPVVKN